MEQVLAPQLLVLGCIDLCFDHPHVPKGTVIQNKQQEIEYGLDRCCVSIIIPQNMVWWRLDTAYRYQECLVREYVDPSERHDQDEKGNPIDPDDPGDISEKWRLDYLRYRHWTTEKSTLYNYDGSDILEEIEHPYGMVPIVRLVDQPKHREPHIGKSRYEAIAGYMREYYNRDSELILSDSLQAHPLLSGYSELCKSDQTVSIGPNYLLPIPETAKGELVPWSYVSPPSDPADSLRKNKQDLMDLKDRHACLTPSSAMTGSKSAPLQSGVSRQIDAINGNKLLTSIAKSLAKAERFIAEYATLCLHNKPPTPKERASIIVNYPSRFELFGALELSQMLMQFQANLQGLALTGCPITQAIWLKEQVRQGLVGLTDDQYRVIDDEIDVYVTQILAMRAKKGETDAPAIASAAEAMQGIGTQLSRAGEDPTGISGGTKVGSLVASVI